MHSPLVLKAIFSLEHAQSTERMAQTLRLLRVPQNEVDDLAQEIPGSAGANWMTMAERIASERTARGVAVVSPELLRAANAMAAKRDTVRINIQDRVSIAPPPSHLGTPPAMTPRPFPMAPSGISAATGYAPPMASAPARRITAVVLPPPNAVRRSGPAPWSVGPSPASALPGLLGASSIGLSGAKTPLRTELEEAIRLLAANPALEANALTPAQKEALRESLRPLLAAASTAGNPMGTSAESVYSVGSPALEQKPISLRPQAKV